MLKAILITVVIVFIVFILALCKVASRSDKWQDKLIEQRKKEEFEGYKYCDDDCYMCDNQGMCERAITKEGQDDNR